MSRNVGAEPAEQSCPTHQTPYVVQISPEEREVGIRTKRYFDRTLKRRPPWLIRNGQISAFKDNLAAGPLEVNPLFEPLPAVASRVIPTELLADEQISAVLASVLLTSKRIEDKLADYSGWGHTLFRNIWGINNSYHQWSFEENQHSDALGLVLERTGHLSQQALEDDYLDNLATSWSPPFPTAREMVLYAAFQEQLTSLAYHALAKRAVEEGAPTVASIMTLIAHDEAYHGGGYRAFSRIFAELDLSGTISDALHVARNFRMPAQHLVRDGNKRGIDIIRVGAFNRQLVSEETIWKVLKGLGFVPLDRARKVADEYWSH